MDAAAPPIKRASETPAQAPAVESNPDAWVLRYTRDHEENFAVLSRLLPRKLQPDFAALYAFCRYSDDLADEADDPDQALSDLAGWRRKLNDCFAGNPRHPIFRALRQTIERRGLTPQPFHDLLDAFVQDQTVTRYDTWDQLLDYCRLSANPVGRLVLMIGGYGDTPENGERFRWSDATCTALQVINHVQDVRRDVLERDRVYLPAELATAHGLSADQLASCIRDDHAARQTNRTEDCAACPPGSIGLRALQPAYRAALRDMTDRAAALFAEGRELWPLLDRPLRRPVQLFTLGGEAVLRRVRAMDHDTPLRRPRLGKPTRVALLARAVLGLPGRGPRLQARVGR